MKQIYISESKMPKRCPDCIFSHYDDYDSLYCTFDCVERNCPLRSLEAHDAEVRKAAIQRFAHKLIDSPDMSEWGLIGQDTIERIAGELVNECNR